MYQTSRRSLTLLLVAVLFPVLSCGEGTDTDPAPLTESRESEISRELASYGLTVSTRDSVIYRVEGRLTDSLFSEARHAIAPLDSLHALTISFKSAPFSNLAGLGSLTRVQSLNMTGNDTLRSLEGFPLLSELTSLNLSGADNLESLEGLPDLPKLVTLNLSATPRLGDLEAMAGLSTLKTLDLSYNGSLADLSHLPGIDTLESLDLSYCDSFNDLNSLPRLPALRTVRIYNTAVKPEDADAFARARGVTIDR